MTSGYMVFVKTSHGPQKCHECRFSNTGKVGLTWSLESTFVNEIQMYLQSASSMYKW